MSSNFTNIIKLLARAIKWNFLFSSDCSSGLYGVYCEKTCSEFCKNKNCDKTNGACANGCRSGYTGRHCNESESIISSYFAYFFLLYQYSTLWFWSFAFRLWLQLILCFTIETRCISFIISPTQFSLSYLIAVSLSSYIFTFNIIIKSNCGMALRLFIRLFRLWVSFKACISIQYRLDWRSTFNFKDILFAIAVIVMLIEILLERNNTGSTCCKRDMFPVKDLNKGKNYFCSMWRKRIWARLRIQL